MGIRVNLFPDARKIVNVSTRGRIQVAKERGRVRIGSAFFVSIFQSIIGNLQGCPIV